MGIRKQRKKTQTDSLRKGGWIKIWFLIEEDKNPTKHENFNIFGYPRLSHPRAYRLGELASQGDNIEKFLVGRQVQIYRKYHVFVWNIVRYYM